MNEQELVNAYREIVALRAKSNEPVFCWRSQRDPVKRRSPCSTTTFKLRGLRTQLRLAGMSQNPASEWPYRCGLVNVAVDVGFGHL